MTANSSITGKLRFSGVLIILGLAVEGLTLVWNHPLSFVAFLFIGGLLVAIGIISYLWALVSQKQQ